MANFDGTCPRYYSLKGLRFFFYSNENNEPAHVHVMKGDAEGKVWLEPMLEVAYLLRFSKSEEKDILEIVAVYKDKFKRSWYEYFNK